MATNHTTNYNLNLWEASDNFVREEFNENTSKIDAALATKATTAALTAETNARTTAVNTLTQTVNQKARIAVGQYTGNGAATRTISVGFTPKAVLLMTASGESGTGNSYGTHTIGGLAVTGSPLTFSYGGQTKPAMEIVSGGFRVFYDVTNDNFNINTNHNLEQYNYFAIG